ncbi:MAG: hypothetical protein OXE77_11915 [Flavobacteriaceae bacterium]|nr:hypothetical protein [Flavobacteriaceae bacterium]MCY4266765.1 hypothetical protein [Flavobacteriaceae bacterium]MCY4298049.1 hypothetical protein [Flavobacteriaceae bacterium]
MEFHSTKAIALGVLIVITLILIRYLYSRIKKDELLKGLEPRIIRKELNRLYKMDSSYEINTSIALQKLLRTIIRLTYNPFLTVKESKKLLKHCCKAIYQNTLMNQELEKLSENIEKIGELERVYSTIYSSSTSRWGDDTFPTTTFDIDEYYLSMDYMEMLGDAIDKIPSPLLPSYHEERKKSQ